MIDLYQVRKDTLGCHDKIFLNSAGASLAPISVSEIIKRYHETEIYNGGYQTEPLFRSELDEFYTQAGILLNCPDKNIAFCYNATDGFGKALSSIIFEKGDVILTSDDDYISNFIIFMSYKKRFGIEIIRIKNLPNGDLDLADAEENILKYTPKLVSITHVPTNSGKIQAVEALGVLCEKYDIWYIVDACQSVGQIKVDVTAIKCDFLSATGRKFLRGPRNTGVLYVSDKVLKSGLHPLNLDMRGAIWDSENTYRLVPDARRFELWESSQYAVLGLKEAIKYCNNIGIQNIEKHNANLCELLKSNLAENSDILVVENGSLSSSIVTFTSRSKSLESVKNILDASRVSYSVSLRNFALIDFNKKNIDWVIRFSPHYFNTGEEIVKACLALN